MSFINNTSADHSAFYCNKLCHNSHFRYGIVINNPYGGIGIAESKNVFFRIIILQEIEMEKMVEVSEFFNLL